MATHLKVTAALFIVMGAVLAAMALFSSVLLGSMAFLVGTSGDADARLGAAIMGVTGAALTLLLITFALPSAICGWGLLRRRRWARTLGIGLAVLALFRFPVGTAFGVYALWVLFSAKTAPLFDSPPPAVA